MAFYEIVWLSSAERDLRKLDRQCIPKIIEAIESLIKEPLPLNSVKLKNSKSNYRLRVGDFRTIYQLDATTKTIIISRIRHRKDVYRR